MGIIEGGPIVLTAGVSDSDGDTVECQRLKDSKVLGSRTAPTPHGGAPARLLELTVPAEGPLFPLDRPEVEVRVNDPVSCFVIVEVAGL